MLGRGQPWRGLGSKVALLAAHLDASGAAADDLILFLDAYDVLLLPAAAAKQRGEEASSYLAYRLRLGRANPGP